MLERYSEAIAAFKAGTAAAPEATPKEDYHLKGMKYKLAECYRNSQDWEKAVAEFKALAEEYPQDAATHKMDAAFCLRQLQRYDEELAILDELYPTHPELRSRIMLQKSEIPQERKEYEQALAMLRQAVADGPSTDYALEAQYRIAWITLHGLRLPAEATALFDELVAAHSDDYINIIEAKFHQVFCRVALGDYATARDMYKTLIETYSSNPTWKRTFELTLAKCQIELKEYAAARQTLSEIMDNYPNTVDAQAAAEWFVTISNK